MNKSILIIEDNDQNLYLLTYILEQYGHSVMQTKNGPDGIAAAKESVFDLILLDIQLPGMDGYSVARELVKNMNEKMVPIIAVTSYAMVGDKEKALESGCTGYITKPINPDTFMATINEFLSSDKSVGEGA